MTDKRMLPDPENHAQLTEAVVVKVARAEEPFTYIELEDGTTLTMRTIVLEVLRVLDRWDQDNNPVYHISTQGLLSISSPDELKKSAKSE